VEEKEELSEERDKCGGEGRVKGELVEAWLGVAESTVERECRERDLLQKKTGEEAGFFRFLDPSFSSLRP